MEKIHTIVTHFRPHLDEVVGIVLLLWYGEKKYPGIGNAKITFCDAGTTPDGKSWQQLEKEGVVLIGTGGSRFDEHPTLHKDRKEGECAASLVATYLGISEEPWLAKLMRYTCINDTKGGSNPFELAGMINLMNKRWFDQNPSATLEWSMNAVQVYLEEQIKFFTETSKEFEMYSEVINSTCKGKDIVIVKVTGDNDQLGAYARSAAGASADIVIQKNSNGNVVISTKKTSFINLDDVARAIRLKEMRIKNITCKNPGDPALKGEAKVPGAEEWHYHKAANMLLNGGKSAPGVPPTKIALGTLVAIVKEELAKIRHQNNPVRKSEYQKAL